MGEVFTNGRVILPDNIRDNVDVVVEDGRIVALLASEDAAVVDRRYRAIDLRGNYLAPGFIDLHVHGAVGRDTMEASAEAFRAICDYHASGGTTSLLLTTATAPLDHICAALGAIRAGKIPQIVGAHVEGPFISREKAGAQNVSFICQPTPDTVARFLGYGNMIKRITLAPEIGGALDAIKKFAASRVSLSGGHSDAWDDEARAAFERGMRSVTHTFNCMSSARRRGVQRVAGLLEFALSEPAISCELIADGHHVSATLMKMLYRAKGARGICLVTDATAGAGLPNGTSFSLGGRDCVVENGVCLLADRSALAGSAASMIDLVRTMVREGGVPVHEAVAMASTNPAREIGLSGKGEIAIGNDADLVVMTPELEVEAVFVRGSLSFRAQRERSRAISSDSPG
ncbi:MAG: N-acetylglucosamine-6-phosphate deacetylase [Chthoniobacterales bacterium]